VIVGHDWGSPIAATSALVRPDVFTAVGLLSVPYSPRGGPRPTDVFARIGGDEEFYVGYFQEPGRAETEIEPDVRGWLAGFYAALSADTTRPAGEGSVFFVPEGAKLSDPFGDRDVLPSWLGERDLDFYAGEFERTGLAGALGRYRNVDRDWEDLARRDGAPITRPSLFVGAELDASAAWLADVIKAHETTLPGLTASHILPGCGHWIQQERPRRRHTGRRGRGRLTGSPPGSSRAGARAVRRGRGRRACGAAGRRRPTVPRTRHRPSRSTGWA
jgi:pimeloyl-ACP methyl ester carboxylesterase